MFLCEPTHDILPAYILIQEYWYIKKYLLLLTEPGSAPRNVQVRPLSSSTMVIQWDEPNAQNGLVTVRLSRDIENEKQLQNVAKKQCCWC